MKTKMENLTVPSLLSVYSQPYGGQMQRWRQLGALDKVRNIKQMLGKSASELESVLEFGCGNGAVLKEIGITYAHLKKAVGVEISSGRVGEASDRLDTTSFKIEAYDGMKVNYPDQSFDFCYATHVLEHVVHPRKFLAEMRRVSGSVIYVEVPLECTVFSTLSKVQKSLMIGHINSYSLEGFQLLLETSGLRVLDLQVFDHSFALQKFRSNYIVAGFKYILRRAALGLLGPRVASKIFSYHCGALCVKASALDIAE